MAIDKPIPTPSEEVLAELSWMVLGWSQTRSAVETSYACRKLEEALSADSLPADLALDLNRVLATSTEMCCSHLDRARLR